MDSLFRAAGQLTIQDIEPFVLLADLLLKSAILLFIFHLCINRFQQKLAPATLHLALIGFVLVLGMLPLLPALQDVFFDPVYPTSLFTLLLPDSPSWAASPSNSVPDSKNLLGFFYLSGLLVLLVRLLVAMQRLKGLRKSADFQLSMEDQTLLQAACSELGIKKPVQFGTSPGIQSLVCFGWLVPIILVPQSWHQWEPEVRSNILKHELAHIQRSDWLTSLVIDIVASLYWFNPVIWHVRKLIANEAEHACDEIVLQDGGCRLNYAEQLLKLAKIASSGQGEIVLSKAMVATSDLTERVEAILAYDQERPGPGTKSKFLLAFVLLALLVTGSMQVVAVEDVNLFKTPTLIYAEKPVYNAQTLWNGLRGQTVLRFDIDAEGNVDPDSIRVVSSTDLHVLAPPAIEAVKQFKYTPRVVGGTPLPARGLEWELNIFGVQASFNPR